VRKNNLHFGIFLSCVFNSFLVFCAERNREEKRIAPFFFLCIFVNLRIVSLRALQNMRGSMQHKRIMPTLKREEVPCMCGLFSSQKHPEVCLIFWITLTAHLRG
jgi:hypothetical protein